MQEKEEEQQKPIALHLSQLPDLHRPVQSSFHLAVCNVHVLVVIRCAYQRVTKHNAFSVLRDVSHISVLDDILKHFN